MRLAFHVLKVTLTMAASYIRGHSQKRKHPRNLIQMLEHVHKTQKDEVFSGTMYLPR